MKNILIFGLLLVSTAAFAQQKNTAPLPETGSVTLSLDEYNRLMELAGKPSRKLDTPPQAYSLKCASIKLRIENDALRGTLQFEGEVFKKGLVKVPLTTGMTVLDARQEGKALPLQQEQGIEVAMLGGPGEFSITLDVALPISIEAGRASFTLPAPSAGSVQLALGIPGEHTDVRITPGLITERKSGKGQTTIEAVLQPGLNASIFWATRETATVAAPKEVRFLASAKTLISVSEAELRTASLVDISVVQ